MSQVLYRTWRPHTFDELVGQEPITRTLKHAIAGGRISHAYLFAGPRGTGKTSMARILAKAINCAKPVDGNPDDTCPACAAINEGRYLDLIEMDAASNRGIAEVQSLLERVRASPAQGRAKVYILDEAHMLTREASNALLKTLEEPPPYAYFILCTTEGHQLLPTILSRCQRYDFVRLSSKDVVGRLRQVADAEKIEADDESLRALARAAGGSLRDAVSLLEQLSVTNEGKLVAERTQEALGLGGGQQALELINHLAFSNAAAALSLIARATWEGVDLRQVHRRTVEYLRALMLLQSDARDVLDLPDDALNTLAALAPKVPLAKVVHCLRLIAQAELRQDSPTPVALELAVVEACLPETAPVAQAAAPEPASAPQARPRPQPPAGRPVPPSPAPGRATMPPTAPHAQRPAAQAPSGPAGTPPRPTGPQRVTTIEQVVATIPPGVTDPEQRLSHGWAALVRYAERVNGKKNLGGLLKNCARQAVEGDKVILYFRHRSHMDWFVEELGNPQTRRALEPVVEAVAGRSCQIECRMAGDNGVSGPGSPTSSPLVRAALGMGARIVEETPGEEDVQ